MVWVLSFPKVPHICHVVEVRQTVGKESGQFAAVPSTNDRPSTDSQSINNFRSSSRRRQIVVVVDFPSRLTVTFFFIMMMRQSIIFVLLSACSVSSVSAFLGQPLSTLATRTKTTTAATPFGCHSHCRCCRCGSCYGSCCGSGCACGGSIPTLPYDYPNKKAYICHSIPKVLWWLCWQLPRCA